MFVEIKMDDIYRELTDMCDGERGLIAVSADYVSIVNLTKIKILIQHKHPSAHIWINKKKDMLQYLLPKT